MHLSDSFISGWFFLGVSVSLSFDGTFVAINESGKIQGFSGTMLRNGEVVELFFVPVLGLFVVEVAPCKHFAHVNSFREFSV